MKPSPVPQPRIPSYPTRREILAGAAGLALAGLCGRWQALPASEEEGAPIAAPIFEHGDGRGTIGPAAVSPPLFLSEEEAMQVIREELGKHGIQLKEASPLKEVSIPPRTRKETTVVTEDDLVKTTEYSTEDHANLKPLRPSGIDPDRKIAVVYVTKMDGDPFGATNLAAPGEYDFKNAAAFVANRVEVFGKTVMYFGVFYDPLVPTKSPSKTGGDANRSNPPKTTNTESQKLVRQQARDFAAWLKRKEVIP